MSVRISVVKENGRVLKGPCLLKGNFHDSVGSLVEGLGFSDRMFSRIIASKSECYSCPHEIALDTPLSVCHDFNLKFVCCFIENPVTQPESSGTVRNAFSPVWAAEGCELRGDQRLRNDVLDILKTYKIGWTPDLVKSTGEYFVAHTLVHHLQSQAIKRPWHSPAKTVCKPPGT